MHVTLVLCRGDFLSGVELSAAAAPSGGRPTARWPPLDSHLGPNHHRVYQLLVVR
jgi:hypothetical protein